MFDLSWTELLIIGVVALIAIGPKELPGVLRAIGQWMGKVRRMASEFQGQFNEAMREAELADLKQQVDDLKDTVSGYTDFDPMDRVQKEFDSFTGDPLADKTMDDAASADPGAVSPSEAAETAPATVSDFSVPQPADTAAKPVKSAAPAKPETQAAAADASGGDAAHEPVREPPPQPKVGSG
jgi:sec-independent protein translocase protein TatB